MVTKNLNQTGTQVNDERAQGLAETRAIPHFQDLPKTDRPKFFTPNGRPRFATVVRWAMPAIKIIAAEFHKKYPNHDFKISVDVNTADPLADAVSLWPLHEHEVEIHEECTGKRRPPQSLLIDVVVYTRSNLHEHYDYMPIADVLEVYS